jgi:hypothetical protein
MDIPKNMDFNPLVKFALIGFCVIIIFFIIMAATPKPNIQKGPDITIHTRFYAGHTYLVFREKVEYNPSISAVHSPDCTHIKCK